MELPEVLSAQHLAVGPLTLGQDLLTVSNEQQAGESTESFADPAVVERGQHGLTSPRRRDDEVAMPVVDQPLDVQGLEHLRLVRIRLNIEAGNAQLRRRRLASTGGLCQCVVESVPVLPGVVWLERRVVPVRLEGG